MVLLVPGQSLRACGDRLPYIATLHLIRLLNEKVSNDPLKRLSSDSVMSLRPPL
jgi:hypothetical protein